jgi:hypothetical protein
MRRFLGWLSIIAWVTLCLSAGGAAQEQSKTAPKKTTSAKSSKKSASGKQPAKSKARSKSAPKKGPAGKTASKSGSKATGKGGSKSGGKTTKSGKKAPPTTWRNRQTEPTAQRYKEIQDALAAKGFLNPEEASGAWGPISEDALKKFQAAQNIDSTGKIDSLSLIALGLGPKHEAAAPAKPPETQQPQAP